MNCVLVTTKLPFSTPPWCACSISRRSSTRRAESESTRHAGLSRISTRWAVNCPPILLRFAIGQFLRLDQLQAMAIGQRLDRLLGCDPSGLERHSHGLDVGLPQARAEIGAA